MKAWVLAARPKTLTAALVPILVGTALAYTQGASIQWWLALFALLSAMFIQIGTNLVNDAIDFQKGADTSKRLGPVRATQSGLLTSRQVFGGAGFAFLLAMGMGIPLVLAGGKPILVIGLMSLVMGYAYTGGPWPLAYLGLGDLFVFLFFGLVAVAGMHFLQAGELDGASLWAGAQVGALATVLIAINNLRDHEGDRVAQKRTLAVRWGVQAVRWEIALLAMAPFVLNLYWMQAGLKWAAVLPLFAFPLAVRLARSIFQTAPGPRYNEFLARAALLHLLFGVLWTVGCFLDSR